MKAAILVRLLAAAAVLPAIGGCSVRQIALDGLGEAIAGGGAAFAAEDDPELARAAAPFSLKLVESLLAESPRNRALLLAAARGFTQYAYAFVQQDAEQAEARDLALARELEERARRLYRRARDYGLRGLALAPDDVALLYWTSAAWGALIALSKDRPEALGDLPMVEALMERALRLDESFGRGAIHVFMIGYEPVRPGAGDDAAVRSRRHFARAAELSGGADAAALVALAEAVCIAQQRRGEFEALLGQALRIDAERFAGDRLAILVAQRRARWLLSRSDQLFAQ
jgi:predicted anti-sigma-YlaC factor YlaD